MPTASLRSGVGQYLNKSGGVSNAVLSRSAGDRSGGQGRQSAVLNQYPLPNDSGTLAAERDVSLNKSFALPWENHKVSLRADAFNVLNFVNWDTSGLSVSLSSPSTSGEFSKAGDARVLQLALRYSF